VPFVALAAYLAAGACCRLFEPSDELYIEAGKQFVADGCCSYAHDRPREIGCDRCPVLVDAKVTEATVEDGLCAYDGCKLVQLTTVGPRGAATCTLMMSTPRSIPTGGCGPIVAGAAPQSTAR
jgi:hypothetical protein